MSRLILTTTAYTPPPSGGGGGGSGEFSWAWPTSDATLAAIRPTGRTLETRKVSATHAGATDATVGAALTAALATASSSIPYGQDGPDFRTDVLIAPGTFHESNGGGSWRNLIGTSGTPSDVILFSDTTANDGVIHPAGSTHVEGLTLRAGHNVGADTSPKYCAHLGGNGVLTFANVHFDASTAVPGDPSHLSSGTVGLDGAPGLYLLFYKCTFTKPPGLSGAGMNLHGSNPGPEPISVMFIDCTLPDGAAFGGPGATDGRPDRLYVVGGTLGGNITANSTTHVYTDAPGSVVAGSHGVTTTSTWPTYTNGLPPEWGSYYLPSSLATTGTVLAKAVVSDAAAMNVVAGRTYYCPVPITSAMRVNRHGVTIVNSAGQWAARPCPDSRVIYGSPYAANYPPVADMPLGGTSATPAAGQVLSAFYYQWAVYPGSTSVSGTAQPGSRMWVGVKFTDSACTVEGSASLPGLHDCYYSDNDGATMVKATAGTPFPIAHVAQVT